MSEEAVQALIEGTEHALGGERSVFVGQRPGDDTVFISFNNGEMETKLRLSFEAAMALRELLGMVSSRGLMAESTWVLVAEDKSEEKSHT